MLDNGKRGEVWIAEINGKKRPVVILSTEINMLLSDLVMQVLKRQKSTFMLLKK